MLAGAIVVVLSSSGVSISYERFREAFDPGRRTGPVAGIHQCRPTLRLRPDPQLGGYAAASIRNAVEQKDTNEIDDETLILDDMARKALRQVEQSVTELLEDRGMNPEGARELARTLSTGEFTHDYPIRVEEARELGLSVNTDVPAGIYELMDLYSQPSGRRPSVQYVDVPYRIARPGAEQHPPNSGFGEN